MLGFAIHPAERAVAQSGTAGLVAHWRFDDGAGAAARDAAGSRHGTLSNGAVWASGRDGSAIAFDGIDDYVSLPSFDVAGTALTLSAWVRNSGFPSSVDQRFVSKASDSAEQSHYWMLSQTTSGGANRLRFRLKTGGTTTTLVASSGSLPLDTWYHVAAVYDGSAMRLYLNGTAVGSVAKTGALSTSASVPVAIGRSPDGSNYMHGAIDDVRVYNRALSAAEIASLGDGAAPGPGNSAPTVALTAPAAGSTYPAPASIVLGAAANDADGTVARVDFYRGTVLLFSDTSSPYSFQWNNVGAGTYSLTALARDNAGATTVSSERVVTVSSPAMPNRAIFVPSSNHSSSVDRYVIDIYPAGADPGVANPVATRDVGKPAVVNGECAADIGTAINGLPPGRYIAIVTAFGPGGSARSVASPPFTR